MPCIAARQDWFGPGSCGSDPDAQGDCNCGDCKRTHDAPISSCSYVSVLSRFWPTHERSWVLSDGYKGAFWENQTFKQPDGSETHCATPEDVFDHFHAPPLSMHFGGIRKPRTYSNKNLSKANGWLLPTASDVGEGGDINFNFTVPAMREWYETTHAHFIKDGMDFW